MRTITTLTLKRSRKQHIVSRWLLANFAAPDGRLWVYTKDKAARRSRPENECVERDYLEFELRGDKTNNRIEIWQSQIEAEASRLHSAIVQRRQISQRDAEIWARFVASLFGRTRKVRNQVSESMVKRVQAWTEDTDSIRDLQLTLLKHGEFHFSDHLRDRIHQMREAMEASQSYYFVSGLPTRIRIVLESLLIRNWHTIEAPPGHCFLISDCPVVTYELRDGQPHPGSGFGNANTAVLLPVSPQHLFVACPRHFTWPAVFTPTGIMNVNRLIVQFAQRNVYANVSSDEIQRWVNTEIDSIVFGGNAFVPPTR